MGLRGTGCMLQGRTTPGPEVPAKSAQGTVQVTTARPKPVIQTVCLLALTTDRLQLLLSVAWADISSLWLIAGIHERISTKL